MDATNRSLFCGAAIMSGLMTRDQLDEVLQVASRATAGPPVPVDQLDDELVAQTAVELGFINRWQAEHMKRGRNKFTLGEYLIVDEIGKGGMGHVFKAEHSMLGRIEAIKVLPRERTSADAIASFQQEIRAHAQLDHPNLARLSYAGQDGTRYYFVTEYVPGTDLRKLVRRHGRLTMHEAATIISQTAQGLDHAHSRGLVHRDVKPGNILVTPEGHVKVIDLGLAGFVTVEDDESDPRAGKLVGTADYLAPESIRQPTEVAPSGDIYSMGCTLYYAVTGKVPYPGGTTADKFRRHCNQSEAPLNPKRFNPELDEDFMEVLADMMEKDPAKRIPTAAEVVRRLAPWTLEAVPGALGEEEASDPSRSRALPPPLPLRSSSQGDTETHFLDDADLTPLAKDSIFQALHETDGAQSASEDTVPLDSPEVIKLGLGIHIYPSHMLLPALLVLSAAITLIVIIALSILS